MKITIESSESPGLAPVGKETDLTTIDGGAPSESLLCLGEAANRARVPMAVTEIDSGEACAVTQEEHKVPVPSTETESINGGAASALDQ